MTQPDLLPHPLDLAHPALPDGDGRELARQWTLARLGEAHAWEMRCGHDEKTGMAAIGEACMAVSACALDDLPPGARAQAFLRLHRSVLKAWQDCELEGEDSSGRSSIGSALARLREGAPPPWDEALAQEWLATWQEDETARQQAQRHSDGLVRRPDGRVKTAARRDAQPPHPVKIASLRAAVTLGAVAMLPARLATALLKALAGRAVWPLVLAALLLWQGLDL